MPKINFDITGDNSNMLQALKETVDKVRQASKVIEDLGKGIDVAQTEEQAKSLSEAIEQNEEKIKDLTEGIEELNEKASEAAESGDLSNAADLKESADKSSDALKALQEQVDAYKQQLDKLTAKLKEAKDAEDDAAKSKEKHNKFLVNLLGGTENYKKIMDNLPTPLKNGADGIKKMVTAAKAFIATPIGAVIAALTLALQSLTAWFRNTADGQMAFIKISAYFEGVMEGLKDLMESLGKQIYDAFTNPKQAVKDLWETIKNDLINRLQGMGRQFVAFGKILKDTFTLNFDELQEDFKELGNAALQTFTGREDIVGDFKNIAEKTKESAENIKAAAEETVQLRAREEKLHRDRSDWQVEEAKLDKQIAEARSKMFTGTDAEKSAAAARAQELINQKYSKQVEFAKEELAIRVRLNEISHSTQEDIDEENRLRAQLIKLDEERIRASSRFDKTAYKSDQNVLKDEMSMQNELNNLIMQNQEKRIQLLEEGADKEIALIDHTYDKEMESIRQLEEKMKLTNLDNLGSDELTPEQLDAVTRARVLAEEAKQKSIQDVEDKYRMDYLSEYGSFEEKKATIAEEYDKKIAATSNENQRKMYEAQKDAALKSLEKQYSASYALIFSDAALMTNTLLAQAITNTQEAIKEATDSGDIQALTELYARLRTQLGEQASRRYGLFAGIVQGAKDLAAARIALENAERNNDKVGLENALAEKSQAIATIKSNAAAISNSIGQVASSLQSFEGTMGKFGDKLANVGNLLEGLASNTDNIVTAFTSENKGEVIAAGVSSAVQLVAMVGNQIKANKEYQEQWNATIKQCAHEYTMLQLEALDYKQSNLFGVENPYQKAIDGAKQYQASMEALLNMQNALAKDGKVQTGTKKAVNWSNVGKGTAMGAGVGAAVGSVIPGLGTAIGTAIGAVVGGIAGLLSTKTVPVFDTLTSQYGELWDENYNLNQQMLADYNKLDDATKQLIDNWDEIKNKALEAEQQMKDNFSEMAGDIGNQLSDKLVQAFRNGDVYDAIDDFHDYMTGTIESIMEQLVFSTLFQGLFDELQQNMIDSFGEGGDGDITDDLIKFTNVYGDKLGEYEEAMRQVQQAMEEQGFDLWGGQSRVAAATGIAKADQDSVDELNGRMTAVQGHTYIISESVKIISSSMLDIQSSVTSIQALATDMAESLRSIKNDMVYIKGDVETMSTRGVKMLS